MSALTAHDRWLQSPASDDPAMSADDEPIIEQMLAEPDCFDAWLTDRLCPPSVAGLLSLILDRGFPRMDKTERDDLLRDRYDACIERVRNDFDDWAQQPARGKAAPVDQWIAEERWPR